MKQAIRTSLEPHYNGKNSFYHNLIKISEYYDLPDFDRNNLSEAKIKHYICPFCPVPLCPPVSPVSLVSPCVSCVPCVPCVHLCPLCPVVSPVSPVSLVSPFPIKKKKHEILRCVALVSHMAQKRCWVSLISYDNIFFLSHANEVKECDFL